MSEKIKCLLSKEECIALMDRVYLALDGALSKEEEKDVFCEVEKYPCCVEKIEIEKKYRMILVEACKCKSVPDSLIVSIKKQVSSQIDGRTL